ncbi:manno protein [Pholiota molesta]|nr:manno protein [Pholiota molesta]
MPFAVTAAILIASVSLGAAQEITGTYPPVPLASKGPFAYPSGIPYKVDTDVGLIRGTQLGYNICNSTTENQQSLCQTAWLNAIDDFCLWAPAEPGHNVGDIEGSMIAWCTKPGHGTRLIPAGALTGVQFTKTPDYVQVVGFFDQTRVNMVAGDYGGEMDPHGADLRGNPMGGIIYSDKFTGAPVQAIEWHNFIGSNSFCLKACDPAGPNAAHFCEHIYDRIGCAYNAPNAARDRVFESCDGDSQDFPGVYTETNANGTATLTLTYRQPAESLGAITSVPYTARVPASSSCRVFESAALYTGLPSAVGAGSTTGAAGAAGAGATGGGSVKPGATTGTAAAAQATGTSGASALAVSGCAVVGGVLLSAVLLV